MKKLYTLISLLAVSIASQAQVVNGGLENWSNPTILDNFAPVTSGTFSANNFLSKEGTVKHSGNFSAGQVSQAATQSFEAELIPVTPGTSYTISYWYLDNDVNVRSRIYSSWVTVSGATVTQIAADLAVLQPTAFSTDDANWIEKTLTLNAPVGATHFKFQIRTYRVSTTAVGGKVYYDDLTFSSGTVATNQFQIAGLKVFVSNKNLNVTSDNNELKTVAVYNILGKQVINTTTFGNPINVSELSSGIYIVKVSENGKTSTLKVVIQ